MTDQELYYKLEPNGCWHETVAESAPLCIHCEKYLHGHWLRTPNGEALFKIHKDEYPDFDTWEGFGWLWERAREKNWWTAFWITVIHRDWTNFIHPTRFKEALKEYLEN